MYCPSCGTKNLDDANFCRTCRSNLSQIPQALTGQLPQQEPERYDRRSRRRRHHGPPTIQNGIQQAFAGLGFLFVAMAIMFFAPAGRLWWFWLLIPAFTMLGRGISEIVAARQQPQQHFPPPQQAIPPVPPAVDYQAPKTGELSQQPPTSVTEGTTKLFE